MRLRGTIDRREAGDTIIEVLISVAVIGTVIASSYFLVNRTSQQNESSQEHTQALGMAESEIEGILHTVSTKNSAALSDLYSTSSTVHCFDLSGTLHDIAAASLSESTPEGAFPSGCTQDNGGWSYRWAFQYMNVDDGSTQISKNYFRVVVYWPSATGSGYNQVEQAYKVPNS